MGNQPANAGGSCSCEACECEGNQPVYEARRPHHHEGAFSGLPYGDPVAIVGKVMGSPHRFKTLADLLAPKQMPSQDLILAIQHHAQTIWGERTRVQHYGSAAANTNLLGADFEYFIETEGPVSLKEVQRLEQALAYDQDLATFSLQTNLRITVALKLHYFEDATRCFGTIELAPRNRAFGEEHNCYDRYFKGNVPAVCAVRMLKYLFSKTFPALTHFQLEDLVKVADGLDPELIVIGMQTADVPRRSVRYAFGLDLFTAIIGDFAQYPNVRHGSLLERHMGIRDQQLMRMADNTRCLVHAHAETRPCVHCSRYIYCQDECMVCYQQRKEYERSLQLQETELEQCLSSTKPENTCATYMKPAFS
eukprot:gnl/TRDRNA2_/TRDRNA2_35560_c0_seq1.p1 gnl/TRDRNA2_/TRDRNA2_35560_c0~~gnl/TRDRNA2_/TRDRNA2_35560_c0_seq1.p1  ORF type:complete len:364 (+),score=43.69 gnl/TRDRNA2_/TRDRNA2_35560_c0_seq1:142-1233(+)